MAAYPAENKKYTYGDYIKWDDNERWELIYGVAYNMSPAPNRTHQRIFGEIFTPIHNYLDGKPCEVYGAPFDVRFPWKDEKDEDIETVVQPDIVVVCDASKLDEKGCKGAPNLIIEIISPYTAKKDIGIKRKLYETFKVQEYWEVDPANKVVSVFKLNEHGKYDLPEAYVPGDALKVGFFEGLEVDLNKVFRE